MDKQQIRKIAEDAFKMHFSDFEIIRIDIEPRVDHDEDRVVDVNIYYYGQTKKLRGAGLLRVHSDIVSKAWGEVDDDLGFPLIHFYSKSTLRRHDSMALKRHRRSSSNSQPKRSTEPSASH